MAYEIQVSATNFTITSSSTEYNVTVSSPATANFTITNNLSTVSVTKNQFTTTIYTDAVELVLADLNLFWRGEWASTSTYTRGDIVTYQYSQYFLDDFNIDPLAVYGPSATPPPSDATWIRFNWHEAPFAVLTVTNSATFFGPVYANNTVEINGAVNANSGLTVASTANFNGVLNSNNLLAATTATFNTATIKLARIQDLVLGGGAEGQGLVVNSTATFNGISNFNEKVNLYNTTTVYGNLVFATTSLVTMANLTITNTLRVQEKFIYNGLEYPKDKGLFGQVLYTNGSTKADWVNLGELVFWSLSNDLYTNGFDIYTNSLTENLAIGVNDSNNFTNSPAYALFEYDGKATVRADNEATLRAGNNYIKVEDGIGEGISVFGNVRLFTGLLTVDDDGIKFSDNSIQTTAVTTSNFVYRIIAGTGTYISTSTGEVTIWNTATSVAGTNVDFKAGVGLSVSTSTNGTITTATYSLNTATAGTIGGVRVGNNLSIDANGILSANTSTPFGNISLSEDMYTNGYSIRLSTTTSTTRLFFNHEKALLNAPELDLSRSGSSILLSTTADTQLRFNNNNKLKVEPNSFEVTLGSNIALSANTSTTVIGTDSNNSTLRVQRIYNYAGTFAPFFPAGVQFQDNTVQFTAYQPDLGLL